MGNSDHPLAYTNVELEGIFRKRVKRRIPKLWEFDRKLYDPYTPKHYVKVQMFIPNPTLEAPLPAVLVMIATAHRSVLFRLASPDDLPGVMFLPPEELLKARQALQDAKLAADDIERMIKSHLDRKHLPEDARKAITDIESSYRAARASSLGDAGGQDA